MVEHDLAKVGVAGSSPVSRSSYYRKGISIRISPFYIKRVLPDSNGFVSSLRFGRRKANVHRTFSFSVPLRSVLTKVHWTFSTPSRFYSTPLPDSNVRGLRFTSVRAEPTSTGRCASPFHSGRRKANVHWTLCFSVPLRSAHNQRPLDVVRRLALFYLIVSRILPQSLYASHTMS